MSLVSDPPPEPYRAWRSVAFVASAALAAAALRFAWHQPLVAGTMLAGILGVVATQAIARRKERRLLRSGDVHSILQRWSRSLERLPHPKTTAPLLMATAFAVCGWVERARAALASAERGPAWDAAIEHRLFLDALLFTFEGDRDEAIEQAERLARLPLPPATQTVRGRVSTLRRAVLALARAFAHQSEPGDRSLLEGASETYPLVFWPMRYAAAVVAIDEGDLLRARALLVKAPAWPAESAFRSFHDEIAARAGLDTGPKTPPPLAPPEPPPPAMRQP